MTIMSFSYDRDDQQQELSYYENPLSVDMESVYTYNNNFPTTTIERPPKPSNAANEGQYRIFLIYY